MTIVWDVVVLSVLQIEFFLLIEIYSSDDRGCIHIEKE